MRAKLPPFGTQVSVYFRPYEERKEWVEKNSIILYRPISYR